MPTSGRLSDARLPVSIFAAMHIAVDARYITATTLEEKQHMLALFYNLLQSQPEHQFTIIISQTGLLPSLPNATEYIGTFTSTGYLQMQRWYGKTLPTLLIQLKADVFIGINCATAKLPIPQIIFFSAPTAAERPFNGRLLRSFYKKYLAKQIVKADTMATFTPLQQTAVAKKLKLDAGRIVSIGYAVPSAFKPADWHQKETLLEEYTNGSEYFLYTGTFDEVTFLLVLKAFSLFKKRQLSNMKLIAAGHFTKDKNLAEKLSNYKYRGDIKLYELADELMLVSLTSAAYAIVHLDEKGLTAFAAAAAVQCQVPVIGLQNSAVEAVATFAGMYAAPTPESLAEQMKKVYKDENLRKQLIDAVPQLPAVTADAAAQKLWDCIAAATTKFRLHLPPKKRPET